MKEESGQEKMEKIVSLCKRRGFIYPGSLIYGGLAGTFDYGPLGLALKKNIENIWWKMFVENKSNIYGIDAAILMNEKVWQASGHVDGFSDPLVEDLKTNRRYRADHLLEEAGFNPAGMNNEQINKTISENNLKSPEGNSLGPVVNFKMMFETKIGADADGGQVSYLRPETAGGIFVNYKNILDSFHPKLPFGIAQIGKAFRNEIAPRDFIFRVRELEQMEIEYFINPRDWEKEFENWRKELWNFIDEIGLPREKVHELEISEQDRAFYSKRTIDFEFDFPFGKKELYGLAYRTNYDLSKHAESSSQKLDYLDEESGEKFIPHVIEPSLGVGRTILALLSSAYDEDEIGGETRTVLRFSPKIAPIKVAVFPLLKNRSELVSKAQEVLNLLKENFSGIMFDDNGNVGKRYRRQDEIGTPYCVTIDFDTIEKDNTVTIRDRDTGEQERISISDLVNYLKEKLK
jgi:glycyl-tRNA synthetase